MQSNIDQIAQTFFLTNRDRIMGVLPFFHSFGFTGTLFLPAALGVGVVYHPNPLDARAIGDMVMKHRATVMLETPTFLQGYTRRGTGRFRQPSPGAGEARKNFRTAPR